MRRCGDSGTSGRGRWSEGEGGEGRMMVGLGVCFGLGLWASWCFVFDVAACWVKKVEARECRG